MGRGVLAGMGAAVTLAPATARALAAAPERVPVVTASAADTQRVALHVEGMTCGGCAISTRAALNRLDGVRRTEVNYQQKRALVTYDPSRATPPRMIAAARTSSATAPAW